MEFSSRRFCRTSSRHSSDSSCGCAFIQPGHEGRETFACAQLIAELMRAILPGDFANAHAIQHSVGRIILLNEDRRIRSIEAVEETLGVGAFPECTHLYGEESGGGI